MRDYYGRVFRAFWDDFKVSTGEQVIGALIVIGIVYFQIHYGVIKPGDINANVWAIAWPYVILLSVLFLYHLLRAPFKLDRDKAIEIAKRDSRISALESFKKTVAEENVCLVVVGCNYLPDVKHLNEEGQVVEASDSLAVTFGNPKQPGVPGKSADVLAWVSFKDVNRTLRHIGRWNQLEQPGRRDHAMSTIDLERITFHPGDEHGLDIAAKFADGLFAYNNDSQRPPGAHREDKRLVGQTVPVTVELVAANVSQKFEFELRYPGNGRVSLVQTKSQVRLVAAGGPDLKAP